MNTASDRRAPEACRIPFDGMVEVGGALGPSFEAQAIDVSEDGMHLRTAYLPEVGQPIRCRFDAGQGLVVVAVGEVLWKDDTGEGGEFGIRFTSLDASSSAALQRMIGLVEGGQAIRTPHGRKVRLHIDGLASPMRARIKGAEGASVTAFSELGFLRVGNPLALEDAGTGAKRPALIDRVEVEVERETRVPQLVVTLRYDDEEAHASEAARGETFEEVQTARDHAEAYVARENPVAEDAPYQPSAYATPRDIPVEHDVRHGHEVHDDDLDDVKSGFLPGATKVATSLQRLVKRGVTTLSLLAANSKSERSKTATAAEAPVRRTTAPAPGGGLHAEGRKVVRGGGDADDVAATAAPASPKFAVTKKRMVVGGAVGVASILALVAWQQRAATSAEVASAATAGAGTQENAALATDASTAAPLALASAGPVASGAPAAGAFAAANDLAAARAPLSGVDDSVAAADARETKPIRVTPFGNGPVSHGNVLKLKLDGAVSSIQGASQPAGFTVVIPGRKSLEAAGPLAAQDSRIAAIRVSNEPGGAELSVTFKDGVPNYQVKARGDTLELHLAKAGQAGEKAPEAHAKPHKRKKH